ncbi:PPE domain-containing protein [Allokutzneria oryzae]|uniref:PPE domain-containing protein n=1 Tax=Allokutzneria oryzae TaxID=1378989 RepID=A0ABV6A8P1_9PSEU
MDVNRDWMSIPHKQLYEKLHGGNGPSGHEPVMLFSNEFAWVLARAYQDLGDALEKMGAVWEGDASDRASGKIGSLKTWAGYAGHGTNRRTESIANQMTAFVNARNSMPEPKEVPSLEELGNSNMFADLFMLKEDQEKAEAAADEAHREAARVMQAYADAVNHSVPDYEDPPRISVEEPGGPRPGPSPIGPSDPGISRPRGGDIGAGNEQIGQRTDGEGVHVAPIPDQRGQHDLDVPDNRLGVAEQTSYTPPSLGEAGQLGTMAGPGAAAVGGSGTVVGGGALVPRAGAGLGGTGQPVTPKPVTAPVTRGVTGRPGAGQSFMQPALGSGQREEDQEHERKYDITDDIVGELPMVAPPVIGE